MSKQQVVQEIHRYATKHFNRRKYTMYGIGDTLQADLIEMQPYKRVNRNHGFILIVVDVFSKRAHCEALKNKTGLEVTRAMERIIKRIDHRINNLKTD